MGLLLFAWMRDARFAAADGQQVRYGPRDLVSFGKQRVEIRVAGGDGSRVTVNFPAEQLPARFEEIDALFKGYVAVFPGMAGLDHGSLLCARVMGDYFLAPIGTNLRLSGPI